METKPFNTLLVNKIKRVRDEISLFDMLDNGLQFNGSVDKLLEI